MTSWQVVLIVALMKADREWGGDEILTVCHYVHML